MKWTLVQAAQSAVRHDNHLRSKYRGIAKRRGNTKVIIAVAKEMTVAMYHMLIRREGYRYNREESVRAKHKKMERVAGLAKILCRT